MANSTFGVNIIPKNNTVTIGNSNSPWTIVSPAMTGTPTAPTAAAGTDNTQVATTAFVKNAVDAARTSVTFTTLGFSIATTDWSETSPYIYTFTNSIIGDNTTIDVYPDYYDGGDGLPKTSWTKAQNGTGPDMKWEPVTGGVKFTVRSIPTDTITGTIRVIGVAQNNRMVEVADTTIPISKGGTGAANAAGAKSNLGLNNVENKSSATIRSEITQANVNAALGTGAGTDKFYREDGSWATPPAATTSAAGYMSAADKTKLNGVETGAQVNPGNATTSAAGLMSAADKSKLDGVAAGATANVGTITGITMNGASMGTSGTVDLGTVVTDVSGKADKADTVLTTTLSRGRLRTAGTGSIAFGNYVSATGDYSMAVGNNNVAAGKHSMASGMGTIAACEEEHAFGVYNVLSSGSEWTAGTSYAVDDRVLYDGRMYKCTSANSDSTFDSSKWTTVNLGGVLETVGCGSSPSARKNARKLTESGNEYLKGNLYVGCNDDSSGGTMVLKKGSTWGALAGASGY